MSLPAAIAGPLVELGLEAGIAIGKRIIQAIANGNKDEWEPLVKILPPEMQSRARMLAEKEKTRIELEKELNG
jgi:hypothetical protein